MLGVAGGFWLEMDSGGSYGGSKCEAVILGLRVKVGRDYRVLEKDPWSTEIWD